MSLIKGSTVEYSGATAPERYGKDRRCSMGGECLTAIDCKEVGKIRETKAKKGIADDGSKDGAEIHLCNLCEGAWAQSGQTIYKFTGLRKKGRVESYPVSTLRVIREREGFSQFALADESGVGRMRIQKLEQEVVEANTKEAGKLARALGVEISDLRREG